MESSQPPAQIRGLLWCILAYTVATAAGWFTTQTLGAYDILWRGAGADIVATLVIFCFSVALNNSSMYDPYWSVAPPFLVLYWMISSPDANQSRAWLILALMTAWGIRLTYNWARYWPGLHHEDWRYVDFRHKMGKAYWLLSFFGLHYFPTVVVFLGCIPLCYALQSPEPLNLWDGAAALVTGLGVWLEAIADRQLHAFRAQRKSPEEIMDQGLWAYSRHPNYLGQMLIWWGAFLFICGTTPEKWWSVAGALSITLMLIFVSIPMMDRRSVQRRPKYQEHMKNVPGLFPFRIFGKG